VWRKVEKERGDPRKKRLGPMKDPSLSKAGDDPINGKESGGGKRKKALEEKGDRTSGGEIKGKKPEAHFESGGGSQGKPLA